MALRREIIAAMSVLAGSGCVPSRDNPRDPAVAPAARLAIVSLEPCGDNRENLANVDPTADYPIVATASRGACLALDATETKDPQGGTMRFTYVLLGTNGDVREIVADDVEEDFVIVPADVLATQNLTLLTRFRVTATDSSGARGTALASVLLTNSVPIPPLPYPILLPEGGFPWAPNQAMSFELDASATVDADRDVPNFCWFTPDSPPFICESDQPTWTPPAVPVEAGRHLYYLQVTDADLYAEKRTFVVRVGPPPLWSGGAGLVRFDETFELWTKPAGTVPWLGRGMDGEEWLFLYDGLANEIEIYDWPTRVSTLHTIPLGITQTAELVSATPLLMGGTRIWVAARTVGTGVELRAYDLDAAGLALTLVGSRVVSDMDVRVLSADFEGNVVLGGDSPIMEFVSATTSSHWGVALSAGTTIEGGAPIPGTSIFSLTATGGTSALEVVGDRIEVWEIRAASEDFGEVVPGPVMPRRNQTLQIGPLRQLEYFDSGHFWAAITNTGLTYFERNSLTRVVNIPDILEVDGDLRVDPGTGTVHLATASSLVSVDVRGRVRRSPIGSGSPDVHFVDASGAVVRDSATPDVVRISRSLDSSALVSVIDLAPVRPERATADGGIWAVTAADAIFHLSEDGTTLDYVTELIPDGGLVSLTKPVGVVDPDGRMGWFTQENATSTLFRVDFAAERVPDAPFRAAAFSITPSLTGFVPIGASNPAAPAPFAWMYSAGPPARYATIDTLGALVVHFTEAGGESDSVAVVAHRSDDLCVFSEVDATGTVRHRRISPLGAVSLPQSFVVGTNGALALRSPFSFHEPDTCGVVAGTNVANVIVWDDAPAFVTSHADVDDLASVTAYGDGLYWGAGTLAGDPDARILVRLTGASGPFAREVFPIDVPNTPVFFP